MRLTRRFLLQLAAGAVLLSGLSCAETGHYGRGARQWREGDIIHYDDGHQYQVSVSTALPQYHVDPGGTYVAAHEESATHYHLLNNPKGPPNQYVRCFARRLPDGTWEHSPQWHENDPKWKLRNRGHNW